MSGSSKNTWYSNFTADEAMVFIENSPFGKDWEGNPLDLKPLKWDALNGMLEFFDGRYRTIVKFQPNGTLRYLGDNNPLNMVEQALAEQRKSDLNLGG